MAHITIYTDGSAYNAHNNRGGYGIVMINGSIKYYCGGCYYHTTSARMEIMGIIKALEKCSNGDQILVYCDNEYAVNALKKRWLFRWLNDNFIGKKNEDLWRLFLKQYHRLNCQVKLEWIRGHNNNKYNEIADILAKQGSEKILQVQDLPHPPKPIKK